MKNKGLVRFLAVCLALTCAFYLSFSLVTMHYDRKAKEYANGDPEKEAYFLDSIAAQKVWFGYTLKQCREKEINLGLDLKGGMTVTMEISVPDILRALSDYSQDSCFNVALLEAQEKQKQSNDPFVTLFVEAYEDIDGAPRLASIFSNYKMRDKIDLDSSNEDIEEILLEEVEDAVDNSFNVLRTRIDRFGVVQPNIQKLSQSGRILIELPGIKDPKRIEKLLQGSANLEFWETYEFAEIANDVMQIDSLFNGNFQPNVGQDGRVGRGPVVGTALRTEMARIDTLLASESVKRLIPRDLRFAWTVKAIDEADLYYQLVALKSGREGRPALEGDVITDAKTDFNQFSAYANVSMSMNAEGAKTWQRITSDNIGKSVAIVLDGYVYSFPTVQNEISGGNSQITGNFTVEEAKDLANTLKSGKMPAPARIVQEDVVGPSLGREAIQSGMWSFLLGFVLILIYMIFYYGWIPGLIADGALLCNVFLLIGVLTSFAAVLTLPGIAGIVLTMGMAVDANVLIYERIREELRAGKNLKKAIDDGFHGAISAIVDANVTSFLTGAILAFFGTGPIKGFAVTYMIGIVTSFLTAVFLTRLWLESYAKREHKSEPTFTTPLMANFLQNMKVDWVGKRKIFYLISGILVAVGILGLEPHIFGKLNLGIDFSGGRNYVIGLDKNVSTADVEQSLTNVFQKEITDDESFSMRVITFGNENKIRVSTNFKIHEDNDSINTMIDSLLYTGMKPFLPAGTTMQEFESTDVNPEIGVLQKQMVGPAIADDITHAAVIAVICALIGIFLYILIRFRNLAYSTGAVTALAHDSILVLGCYALLWKVMPFSMEIDQSFIAAILTVIGYSINDTVVIFDRVREYNKLYSKRDRATNINDAINATLSRTFSTSMSTFVVLLAIFVFGGESIQGFVFALLIGVIVGTYSSLCLAPNIAYAIQKSQDRRREKKLQK